MTLAATPYKKSYDGDGVTATYPVPFYFLEDGDIRVNDVVTATGIPTPLVLGIDYTLVGAGVLAGGSLTRIAATLVGHTLVIERSLAGGQPTHFVDGDPLPAAGLEQALDRLGMLYQQSETRLDRSVLVPIGLSVNPAIQGAPTPGYALGVDAPGTGLAFVPNTGADQVADLGDTTSALKGAGRVGFNYALAYAAGTIGKWLKDLAGSLGATFIGYLAAFAGAVLRTQHDKNMETVYVEDFGAVGNNIVDDTASILAALNSGAKQVNLSWKTYKATAPIVVPPGVSFVGKGPRNSIISKAHFGDGISVTNALAYNQLAVDGIGVTAPVGYTQTGKAFNLKQCVRTQFRDLNATDCLYGIYLDGTLVCDFAGVTLDRCGTGIYKNAGCNHNSWMGLRIISNTGFTGIRMTGTSFANIFNTVDIEYAQYPLWFDAGVRDVTFVNYYAEFNTNGARLETNVKNIAFIGVFNSSVPLIDQATFGASDVQVYGLTDEYPAGVGGVPISGNIGNPGIRLAQSQPLIQAGVFNSTYNVSDYSAFGLNAGSPFEWDGQPLPQYVSTIDLTNGAWVGSGALVTQTGGSIGGADAYQFPAGAYRTWSGSVGAAMANRTFTLCALVQGVAGQQVTLKMADNVGGNVNQAFQLADSSIHLIHLTAPWTASSTNNNCAVTLQNTGASPVSCSMPNLWESPGPLPPTSRTIGVNGYTSYPMVKFRNLGRQVTVYGSAMPSSGAWQIGDSCINTAPTNAAGQPQGWIRVTTGSGNVLNTDWRAFGITT